MLTNLKNIIIITMCNCKSSMDIRGRCDMKYKEDFINCPAKMDTVLFHFLNESEYYYLIQDIGVNKTFKLCGFKSAIKKRFHLNDKQYKELNNLVIMEYMERKENGF